MYVLQSMANENKLDLNQTTSLVTHYKVFRLVSKSQEEDADKNDEDPYTPKDSWVSIEDSELAKKQTATVVGKVKSLPSATENGNKSR